MRGKRPQQIVDRFMAESHDLVRCLGRNFHVGLTVLKVFNRLHDDLFCHINRIMFDELDMDGASILPFGDVVINLVW